MDERRRAAIVALVPFVAAMAAFSFTVAPSIYPGDSPEFTAAAHVLGVPHPPGYPHYVVLGKIAGFLPLGNAAFRLNLLSALGTAAASSVFALLAFRLTGLASASVLGAVLMAFSADVWAQSGSAEVYTLHVLGLLLLLSLAERVPPAPPPIDGPERSRHDRHLLFSAAFLFGFTLGIHYFILFALPGIAFLFTRRMGWKTVAVSIPPATLCALAGWSLFLLLPLRASTGPPLNWGETSTPADFFAHIFWSQYSGRPSLAFSWERLAQRAFDLIRLCGRQWPWPVAFLLPPGAFFLWRRFRYDLLPAILLLLVLPAAGTLYLLNDPSPEIFLGISSNKFLGTYALLALVSALGAAQVWEWAARFAARRPGKTFRRAAGAICLAALALLAVATIRANRGAADRSGSLQLHAYTLNLLDPLPPASGLATEYDVPTFPLLYFRLVEGYREDVALYGRSGNLFRTDYNAAYRETLPSEQDRIRKEIDRVLSRRHLGNFYFSDQVAPYAPGGEEISVPFGLLYRSPGAKAGSPPDLWSSEFITTPFLRPATVNLDHRNRELVSDMYRMAAERSLFLGRREEAAESLGKSVAAAPDGYWSRYYAGVLKYKGWGDAVGAEEQLQAAIRIIPSEDAYAKLGIIRFETGDLPGAIRAFESSLSVNGEFAPALYNLAECFIAAGDVGKAEENLERATRSAPKDPRSWRRLGEVQGAEGKYAKAVRSLSRAIDLSPDDAETYLLRGIARRSAGDTAGGAEDLGEADRLGADTTRKAAARRNTERR